ncbi:MAG: HAD family phosphatase [Puniceicoccales bacterium]|jgi:beta-phosphoglucomutase-like phosphatase (HAD superfamily)|nr:HAD family phosphatase [Puniceicoccales bacterium]
MAEIHPANLELLHSSPYRAFIFDCDGTVGDTMGLHYAAWKRTLRDFAVDVDVSWDEFCAEGGRDMSISVRKYTERCGHSIDGERFLKHMGNLYERCLSYHLTVLPVKPVVSFICAEERPMAIASSGFRKNVHSVIDGIGLTKKIRAVVTREDVTREGVVHAKPEPDLFLMAAERLAADPEECLVFGDSPLDGQAAEAAHMDFFRVTQKWWNLSLREFDWDRVEVLPSGN